ncbi:unnamed protein product [Urochloa humidicola]
MQDGHRDDHVVRDGGRAAGQAWRGAGAGVCAAGVAGLPQRALVVAPAPEHRDVARPVVASTDRRRRALRRLYGRRWDAHRDVAWALGGQRPHRQHGEGARTVGLLSAMVDVLPGKLGELLEQQEYALLSGNGDNIRLLQAELGSMRGAIRDCELFLDEPDVQTRDWANRVRELAYDIEDWVDLFPFRVHAGGGGGKPSSSRLLRWLPRFERKLTMLPVVANELQNLKERALDVRDRWGRYNIGQRAHPSAPRPIDSRLTTVFVDPGDLVGLDVPTEEVANMVMDAVDKAQAAQLKIVSIVGMAGSGKTTLANAVYKRLGRQNLFQCQAFVSVGRKPDLSKVLSEMLSKLTNRHQVDDGISNLINRIGQILDERRYLIVVDDLWSTGDWYTIDRCFPENYLGSRIITTTRNVALAMGCDCIYNIRLLDEYDSRKLILKRIFGSAHRSPYELHYIFHQITSRCGGLPLALVTIASILGDHSVDEWAMLTGSRWLSMSHPDAEVMKQVLSLSYDDLPPNLQMFMLHLSIFPENYAAESERIVRRLIAHQYMVCAPGTTVDETARNYLDELINRNMVQPLHQIHDVPRYCRLHPVIHDFIVIESMKDNFLTLVDDQNPVLNHGTVHHLSIESSKEDQDMDQDLSIDSSQKRKDLSIDMNLSHVRSITVFGQVSAAPRLTDLSLVRVLDLEGCHGPVCLDCLNNLPLLRHLGLRRTDVSELPAAIWELRHLETLDVRSTKVKELPRGIVGLRDTLKTLLFSHEGTINSDETATRIAGDIQHCCRLENLATIDLREHHASIVKDLGALHSLRVITIMWSFQQCTDAPYCEALRSSMEKWSKLESITIHCGFGCLMEFMSCLSHPPSRLEKFKVTVGRFAYVPPWIKDLVSLSFLQIIVCELGADDLEMLRNLPKLQLLILGLEFVPREAIVIDSEGFGELQKFSVNCPVPWFTFRTGAMPKLTHLQLEFCSGSGRQESVPYGVNNLQWLREVVLLYNEKWCANSSSVKMTVDAVKRQVVKHRSPINLIINDTKVDVVLEVDEDTQSTPEIQSDDDQVQQVGDDILRTTIETWGKAETEVVADNMNDA